MNKTLIILLSGLAMQAGYANCDQSTAAPSADPNTKAITTADLKGTEAVVLKVKQITCANCAKKIQKALTNTNGVKMVQVDVTHKTVTVHYLPTQTKPESLLASLKEKTLYEGEIL